MTLTVPSECRPLPVRLCDVRLEVRLHAARQVIAREPGSRDEMMGVAWQPSNLTYYVSESALPILLKVAA